MFTSRYSKINIMDFKTRLLQFKRQTENKHSLNNSTKLPITLHFSSK